MHAGAFQSVDPIASVKSGRTTHVLLPVLVVLAVVLSGCASRSTQAPVTDLSTEVPTPAPGDSYVVKPGDTLYQIAQSHNTDVATLMRINGISDPTQLRVGQRLNLAPGAGAPASPPSSTAPSAATPLPVTPVETVENKTPPRASDASLIEWGWPAAGNIIQNFNANTKGIDLAGTQGEPVVAAAAGEVMYAGNGVRGLGNLILIKHAKDFITAYAHNEKLLVKTGQKVQKGEKIATIGQSDTTTPRLHFEIRRRGTPVNPLAYLPAR